MNILKRHNGSIKNKTKEKERYYNSLSWQTTSGIEKINFAEEDINLLTQEDDKVLTFMPRRRGKTTLICAEASYNLRNVPNSATFIFAATSSAAHTLFNMLANIVCERNNSFAKYSNSYITRDGFTIVNKKNNSVVIVSDNVIRSYILSHFKNVKTLFMLVDEFSYINPRELSELVTIANIHNIKIKLYGTPAYNYRDLCSIKKGTSGLFLGFVINDPYDMLCGDFEIVPEYERNFIDLTALSS